MQRRFHISSSKILTVNYLIPSTGERFVYLIFILYMIKRF